MIRQLLDVVKHLMTDITLRLPLTDSAPVYLDLVCLDIVDCCQLRLPDSLLDSLLGRLLYRPGCVLGLFVRHVRFFLVS